MIKAPRQGSTVGVYIVKEESEIAGALAEAAKYDDELLVEKFIPGRELTVGVLGDLALPILEIIPKSGFYDFNDKYPFLNPQGGGGAQHVCPAADSDATRREQNPGPRAAATQALDLEVYSRVDVMLSPDDRAVRARDQHHSRHDRDQPAAGSGRRRRDFLSATLRAHHRALARGPRLQDNAFAQIQ